MNRTPPAKVMQILRTEVGFGCPVPNCGNPYLEWHHFNHVWKDKEHHNPEGMIALCAEHHKKADVGGFTNEQLHKFKLQGKKSFEKIKGRFDWLRNKLIVVIGGNLFYETLNILQIGTKPIIWLRRDENGYLLLNFRMLTLSGENRLILEDNNWLQQGDLSDFECPPSGKLIKAKYPNGDVLKIEFFNLKSREELTSRYPKVGTKLLDSAFPSLVSNIEFPLTVVEVKNNVEGADISFNSTAKMKNMIFENCIFNKVEGFIIQLPYESKLLDPNLHNFLEDFLFSRRTQMHI